MAETIFKVGDKVILGEHEQIDPDDYESKHWFKNMSKYVGETAIITDICGKDDYNCRIYVVDVDDGYHYWRGINMRPFGTSVFGQLHSDFKNPPRCKRCHTPAPWAEPSPEFTCYSCRHH